MYTGLHGKRKQALLWCMEMIAYGERLRFTSLIKYEGNQNARSFDVTVANSCMSQSAMITILVVLKMNSDDRYSSRL